MPRRWQRRAVNRKSELTSRRAGVVDASLAAILQEIAQRMESDRKLEREALAAMARELRLLRAELRRKKTGARNAPVGNGHASEEAEVEALIA